MVFGPYLKKRNGFWQYHRRVPRDFSHLDRRQRVVQSTKIKVDDDPKGKKAAKIAEHLNASTEAYWRGLAEGRSAESALRFEAARRRARALGFDYATAAEIEQRGAGEILDRLERLLERGDIESETDVAALHGGEEQPKIMVSEIYDRYAAIMAPQLDRMSKNQLRKWRGTRMRALRNFQDALGMDKPIGELRRADAVDFSDEMQMRISDGEIVVASANKEIGTVSKMVRTLDLRHRLNIGNLFSGLRISGGEKRSRPPFSVEHLRDNILAPGALAGLSAAAQAVVCVMTETGMRPSEILNLTKNTIHLGWAPYVSVEPEGRITKTDDSERDIPLVGVALAAMAKNPSGFPAARDRADNISQEINNYWLASGLRPTPKHSLYSIRHTFEDRLTALNPPDKVIASLMGHSHYRPKYGEGVSLDVKRDWLQRMAFTGISIE